MRGSPEARCANLLYSCGSGEPYRSKQCGLEVGKVKAKRPISTGFEPFLLENSGICWFLLVFLAMRRARLCPRPRISHKSYAHRGVVFSHRTGKHPEFSGSKVTVAWRRSDACDGIHERQKRGIPTGRRAHSVLV